MTDYKEYKVRVYNDGAEKWFFNSKKHRENDLPAVVLANGTKLFYQNGKRHRENGPAIIFANGDKSWYLNGEEMSEEEFNKRKDTVFTMSCQSETKSEMGLTVEELAAKASKNIVKIWEERISDMTENLDYYYQVYQHDPEGKDIYEEYLQEMVGGVKLYEEAKRYLDRK